jgi:hypothetical protein
MITTVLLAYVAGFFAGNDPPLLPTGSVGQTNHTPFGQSATVNVTVGCVAFAIAAICWHFANTPAHPLPADAAALAGLLTVGVIHARGWHNNPWARHHSAQTLTSQTADSFTSRLRRRPDQPDPAERGLPSVAAWVRATTNGGEADVKFALLQVGLKDFVVDRRRRW